MPAVAFFPLLSVFLLGINTLYAQPLQFKKRTLPDALEEVSGMTRLPSGDLWLLNDSHNPPELFRFDPQKDSLLEVVLLPVPNIDWEDLASDAAGNLYIGDFGNNYNKRRNLRIYILNPGTGLLDSILFRYPDQQAFPPSHAAALNFNMEAMVYFQDSLHLFSKNIFKGNSISKHYVLPAKPGNYTAELRDSILLKNRVVTGAAISRDGRQLALTSYIIGKKFGIFPYTRATAYFFSNFQGSQFFKGEKSSRRLPKRFVSRQFESITNWEDNIWLVANEGKGSQTQAIWKLKVKTR